MTAGDRAIRWAATIAVAVVAAIAAVASYSHAYELVVTHGERGALARAIPLTIDGLIVSAGLVILDCARHRRSPPVLARLLLAAGIAATLGANIAHGAAHGWVGMVVAGWPAAVATGCFEMSMRLIRGGSAAETKAEISALKPAEISVPESTAPAGLEHAPAHGRVTESVTPIDLGLDPVAAAPETGHGVADPVVASTGPQCSEPASGTAPTAFGTAPTGAGLNTGTEHPDPVVATARDRFAEQLAAGELPSLRQIRRELHCGHPKATRIREALTAEKR